MKIKEQIDFIRQQIEKRKENKMADAFISGYLLDLIEELYKITEEQKINTRSNN